LFSTKNGKLLCPRLHKRNGSSPCSLAAKTLPGEYIFKTPIPSLCTPKCWLVCNLIGYFGGGSSATWTNTSESKFPDVQQIQTQECRCADHEDFEVKQCQPVR
jgi:hypothetical protein